MTRSRSAPSLAKAQSLSGRPVVTLGGDRTVEVKDVVFDGDSGSVTGFTLQKTGFLGGTADTVLPIGGVKAVGDHAVMVGDHDVFAAGRELSGTGSELVGGKVMTDDGTELGRVLDVVLDVGRQPPIVVGFELAPTPAVSDADEPVYLPVPDDRVVSAEAVVVPAAAREAICVDVEALADHLSSPSSSSGSTKRSSGSPDTSPGRSGGPTGSSAAKKGSKR
jgi:sporulation protein YlmC with PRC-barrel domain